jgi:5-methylcytosine-specific restriction endonuclease McrA
VRTQEEIKQATRAATIKWRLANPEQMKRSRRESMKRWREANPEIAAARSLASGRKWKAAHPDEHRAANRAYYAKKSRDPIFRAKVCRLSGEWAKANPLLRRINEARRRARIRGSGGSHTAAEWTALCRSGSWQCFYCATVVDVETAIQEHMIPLARGGSDNIENIAVSCAVCNSRKHTMTVEEFMAKEAA